mmetsp:Transcript_6386/g.12363  ORF Transcript_6386/g.12363 Transcript_6386/m.12363 type:complete len:156 (-) Transcript_6386:212-679(-)|eukprot:CAMPEP_0173405870 /NCGR_PEP_ID=MMETSP1356-20130122/62993_1 /TAXON_ID=77927 ORGANISM="Hemiselmis virescens, Strain PCC157" /NCGR_SAMPLE_ID=MMETSP1356 /ASSEMBLY_ACC=CAM_ASM_000847 /LENGTH=155 /DNA_ID=CAMNT_0014366741 /DNA_START=34 /DNA_END=501 /DNA_ORIENTATION=+
MGLICRSALLAMVLFGLSETRAPDVKKLLSSPSPRLLFAPHYLIVFGAGGRSLGGTRGRRAEGCTGMCCADSESESEKRRLQYNKDRAEREEILLKDSLRLAKQTIDCEDKRPDFIARWGGADLAAEGPTRKVLELMCDSEWATDDWASGETEGK